MARTLQASMVMPISILKIEIGYLTEFLNNLNTPGIIPAQAWDWYLNSFFNMGIMDVQMRANVKLVESIYIFRHLFERAQQAVPTFTNSQHADDNAPPVANRCARLAAFLSKTARRISLFPFSTTTPAPAPDNNIGAAPRVRAHQ